MSNDSSIDPDISIWSGDISIHRKILDCIILFVKLDGVRLYRISRTSNFRTIVIATIIYTSIVGSIGAYLASFVKFRVEDVVVQIVLYLVAFSPAMILISMFRKRNNVRFFIIISTINVFWQSVLILMACLSLLIFNNSALKDYDLIKSGKGEDTALYARNCYSFELMKFIEESKLKLSKINTSYRSDVMAGPFLIISLIKSEEIHREFSASLSPDVIRRMYHDMKFVIDAHEEIKNIESEFDKAYPMSRPIGYGFITLLAISNIMMLSIIVTSYSRKRVMAASIVILGVIFGGVFKSTAYAFINSRGDFVISADDRLIILDKEIERNKILCEPSEKFRSPDYNEDL